MTRGWCCEAYGDGDQLVTRLDGTAAPVRDLCFWEAAGECASAGECAARMADERRRLHGRLVELAGAPGDDLAQLVARDVLRDLSGPDELLNAGYKTTGTTTGNGERGSGGISGSHNAGV